MAAKKGIDSPDFEAESPTDIEGFYTPEPKEIEIIPGTTSGVKGKGGLSKQAQDLAFMEEYIEVMLHESTDKNAENPVFTSNNGTPQYFYRGQVQRVRRKYVDILASCKEHSLATPEYTTNEGTRSMKITRRSSLKYPFSVINDPNPRGAAWLRSVLSAPT